MSSSCYKWLDFEQWSELACQDPEEFEAMRHELIEALIDSAPDRRRQRLRGLQWQIDQVRLHAPSPMAACILLSNMMWESFAGEGGLADVLNRGRAGEGRAATSAEVVRLLPNQKR